LSDFHGSGSIHTLRKILHSWPLDEVRAFFEGELGIPLKNEASGKVFPRSDRSRDVVEALLVELRRSGAELRSPFRVVSLAALGGGGFELVSDRGESLRGDRVVLATGGLSLPKTGSDGGGLELARRLGHGRIEAHAALVPLLTSDATWTTLSGISLPVRASVEEGGRPVERRTGDFLFTHRGFSGPVVLDLSRHFTRPGSTARLFVQWGGGESGEWDARLREGGKAGLRSVLRERLPDRLGRCLLERAGLDPALRLGDLDRAKRLRLVEVLERCELAVSGDEGYATAEVTAGGIPLAEISPRTLESRIVPGLHFCGEILDVTGRLGGYNFLWSWVSGRRAGQAAALSRS
jgi:hypothetical protein